MNRLRCCKDEDEIRTLVEASDWPEDPETWGESAEAQAEQEQMMRFMDGNF